MSAVGADNVNGNANDNNDNAIKDTKLYIAVVTFRKGFERLVYWNEYQPKRDDKIWQMNFHILSNKTLLELIDCFFKFI